MRLTVEHVRAVMLGVQGLLTEPPAGARILDLSERHHSVDVAGLSD